jgi:hypothetical protein
MSLSSESNKLTTEEEVFLEIVAMHLLDYTASHTNRMRFCIDISYEISLTLSCSALYVSEKLLPAFPNIVNSCSRQDVTTARLASKRS